MVCKAHLGGVLDVGLARILEHGGLEVQQARRLDARAHVGDLLLHVSQGRGGAVSKRLDAGDMFNHRHRMVGGRVGARQGPDGAQYGHGAR